MKGDMELYSRLSHDITEIIQEKAPVVEKASIDEKVEERMKQIAEAHNKQGSQGAERSSNEGKLNAAIESAQTGERKSILDLNA